MNVRTARLVTNGLAGVCGALALLAVVQYAGFGRGYGWAPDPEGEASHSQIGAIDNKPVQLPPASAFAGIEQHPLFNEDRQPTPVSAGEGEGAEEAPPLSPLNIALTGVILDDANNVRIAMVQDKTRNQAVALRVGMPLEGEQASWTLVDVKPRGVVFRSAANETTEVALETSVVQPAPPRPAPRAPVRPAAGGKAAAAPGKGAAGSKAAGSDAKGDAAGSSADLARRIEERRRQMREDAERLRNGGNKPATEKK